MVLHQFLSHNRADLIARCIAKVARRPQRGATRPQLANGIPMFLDQLTQTLEAEEADEAATSLRISGASGGDASALSEMGVSATAHGKALQHLGYSVDQVVHDYGDLCQAVTDLAFERDAPFSVDEYRTLNRCLDNAIADAVTEFSARRDAGVVAQQRVRETEHLGFVMHELRNTLSTAQLALSALELSGMPVTGATGALLRRSHALLGQLISNALSDVTVQHEETKELVSLATFIADAQSEAQLDAASRACPFEVTEVDPSLGIKVNPELMRGALLNLLHNAFKFTHAHTRVTLSAYAAEKRILIDVRDHCGGLPPGNAEKLFTPFTQRSADKTGMGLGLSIARQHVQADGGTLSVRDLPGEGCVFTIELPLFRLNSMS